MLQIQGTIDRISILKDTLLTKSVVHFAERLTEISESWSNDDSLIIMISHPNIIIIFVWLPVLEHMYLYYCTVYNANMLTFGLLFVL